jgi:hypothetical protein
MLAISIYDLTPQILEEIIELYDQVCGGQAKKVLKNNPAEELLSKVIYTIIKYPDYRAELRFGSKLHFNDKLTVHEVRKGGIIGFYYLSYGENRDLAEEIFESLLNKIDDLIRLKGLAKCEWSGMESQDLPK